MRTRKRLIELSNKKESWIYKDILKTLSGKLFISKLQIKVIRAIPDFKYNLYEDLIEYYTIWEYFYIHQDEIKNLLIQELWSLYTFDLSNKEWKVDAIAFVFSYNLDKIIKDI